MANLSSGLGGAASGAALGSAILPGIGTAIGAVGGFLTGLFGGGNDSKPQLPPITDPVTGQQISSANQSTQESLAKQNAFVNALAAQNGIGNQSQVYNQLQDVVAGKGPNPATAMLANATGANNANTAALMASQRGAAVNPGMIARLAARQGAANQQNAAGQAAELQAQQSLGALGQAGSLATTQVGQQQNAINALQQGQLTNQGQLLGAQGQYNAALTAGQGNVNAVNQEQNRLNAQEMAGALSGVGAAATALAPTKSTNPAAPNVGTSSTSTPTTVTPAANQTATMQPVTAYADGGMIKPKSFVAAHLKRMAHGEQVPALLSPGEHYLPPQEVKAVVEGKKDVLKAGKVVPGKPKYRGNDYRNDVVPRTLKSGGVVIPNKVLQSSQPHEMAEKFVAAIVARPSRPKKSLHK